MSQSNELDNRVSDIILHVKNKFFKNSQVTRLKIVVLLIVVLVIALYRSDTVMFALPLAIQSKFSIGVENQLDKVRTPLMKSIDAINPTILFLGPSDQLKHFNLQLKRSNIKYISDVIYRSKDNDFISNYDNEFKAAKLTYKGKEYKIKVRLHGSSSPNFVDKKKSYAIKTKKHELIDNMRRFSFVILDEMSIPALFAYKLMAKYNGFNINTELVTLSINGVYQGLYFLEEKLHKSVLEKNGYAGVDLIKQNDEWNTQYVTDHQDPFGKMAAYTKIRYNSGKQIGQLLRYKEMLHSTNEFHTLSALIDIDKFAKLDAYRVLFGNYHPIEGDNLRYLYDTSTGKISPFIRIENYINKLQKNSYADNFEKNLYSSSSVGKLDDNLVFQALVKNDLYRTKRNMYLYELVRDKESLVNLYDDLVDKYRKHIKKDVTGKHSSRYYLHYINGARKNLIENINKLSQYINYARVFTDVEMFDSKKLVIEVSADSNTPVVISDFQFFYKNKPLQNIIIEVEDLQTNIKEKMDVNDLSHFFAGKSHMLGIDVNMDLETKTYKYRVKFLEPVQIDSYNSSYIHSFSKKAIDAKQVYQYFSRNLDQYSLGYISVGLDDFISNNKELTLGKYDNNTLIIKSGNYKLTDSIVFPYGIGLIIEGGTSIQIAANKSVLIYGDLIIKGKNDAPVKISSAYNGHPFGTFAVVGDKTTNVSIDYLDISGGSEDVINGAFLSGALSIYSHSSVTISNSYIHNNKADDGLNVKDAAVMLENNRFESNFADQVDLDNCKAIVVNNLFKAGPDDNGDGLDLSGAKVIVKKSTFEQFSDKGISIGEKSKVFVYKNYFKRNRSAITAKDSSKVYVNSNSFSANAIDLEAYQKKAIFGYPAVFLVNEQMDKYKIKNKTPIKVQSIAHMLNDDLLKDLSVFEKLH